MQKVKLGFLGCGFMGQLAHMQNYAALDTCEIVAITDAKHEQAKKAAQAYFIPKVYASATEMLADPDIDAVVASQQYNNHVNIVCDVLNAGKHLLTEKPLCLYPQNGKRLVECAAKNKKIHMVGNHKRSDPATEYALKLINEWKASGEMGKLNYIRLSITHGDWICGSAGVNRPIVTSEENAAYTPEQIPDGVDPAISDKYNYFVNNYIHQVNLMRYLLGEDYRLAYGDRSGVLLATESVSGVPGVIEMDAFHSTNKWHEFAMVCFEKGYVRISLAAPLASQRAGEVTVFADNGGGGVFTSPVLPNISAMRNQAINFIKAVNGEIAPPCPSSEAIKDLEFAMEYFNFIRDGHI